MRSDYDNKVFQNFTEYPTSTGFTLHSVEEAMQFNAFHEGLRVTIYSVQTNRNNCRFFHTHRHISCVVNARIIAQ